MKKIICTFSHHNIPRESRRRKMKKYWIKRDGNKLMNFSSDSHIQYGNGTIITSLGARYEVAISFFFGNNPNTCGVRKNHVTFEKMRWGVVSYCRLNIHHALWKESSSFHWFCTCYYSSWSVAFILDTCQKLLIKKVVHTIFENMQKDVISYCIL